MTRSTAERISDILNSIDRCSRYAPSLENEDQDIAEMAADAVQRNLQMIGEAVNHLPPELTAQYPNIAWPQIRGFRNILVHEYFGVDTEIVKDVIATHLSLLSEALEDALRRLES